MNKSESGRPLRVLAASIAHNEERKVGSVVSRFNPNCVDEILVVDDGSTDATAEVARTKGATVISRPQRGGAGAAIRTASDYARQNGFDVLVILAGNDKDRPTEIPRLLQPIREEGYDLCSGFTLSGGRQLRQHAAVQTVRHPIRTPMAVLVVHGPPDH